MKFKKISLLVLMLSSISAYGETINFSGTVSTSCTFSNQAAGALVATSNGSEYILDAGFNTGGAARVDIAYTGSPSFGIAAVSGFSSSPGGTPALSSIVTGISFSNSTNNSNAITAGANSFTSGSKTFSLTGTASSDNIYVFMKAIAASPFPVGQYDANTTITCQ